MMKILLVQTSFLGDTILSTPVIAGLKTIYPDAELWMMTTPLAAQLVARDPFLTGVIPFDKRSTASGPVGLLRMSRKIRQMGFDRVYSLHRSYRTSVLLFLSRIPMRIGCTDASLSFCYHQTRARDFSRHDVIRNLSILKEELNIDTFAGEMRLFAPKRDAVCRDALDRLESFDGPYAVLAPGSVWKTKMWFTAGYHAIAAHLLEQGYQVVLIGAETDRPVCESAASDLPVHNLAGITSIADTLYVVQRANLMVCNDSMALHMASAFKVPTVTIFCATSPKFGYGPWKNRAIVVEKKGLHCKPCRPHGSPACPEGTEACMRDLLPETVIQAIETVLSGREIVHERG